MSINAKIFPRRAGGYNDITIKCPSCHKLIVIFAGHHKNHICYKCGHKISDKLWKSNNVAYKRIKTSTLMAE